MKFTKENVLGEFKQWRDTSNGATGSFYSAIMDLDDTPEKVVIPKFVADWIELCKEKANLIDCLQGGYRHFNGCEHIGEDEDWLFEGDNQDVVARAWLDGYEVEKEPLYYIPLPHLETSDGIQQVLSKRKGDKHYFASRPSDELKQRYTKEELEQVPEFYKPFATLIEEEAND